MRPRCFEETAGWLLEPPNCAQLLCVIVESALNLPLTHVRSIFFTTFLQKNAQKHICHRRDQCLTDFLNATSSIFFLRFVVKVIVWVLPIAFTRYAYTFVGDSFCCANMQMIFSSLIAQKSWSYFFNYEKRWIFNSSMLSHECAHVHV